MGGSFKRENYKREGRCLYKKVESYYYREEVKIMLVFEIGVIFLMVGEYVVENNMDGICLRKINMGSFRNIIV